MGHPSLALGLQLHVCKPCDIVHRSFGFSSLFNKLFFLIDLFSNSQIFYFDVFNLMLIPINDFFYFKYYIFHV